MATNADAQIRVSADVSSAISQLNELTNAVNNVNNATTALQGKKGSFSSSLTSGLNKTLADYQKAMQEFAKIASQTNSTLLNQQVRNQSNAFAQNTQKQLRSIQSVNEALKKEMQTRQQLSTMASQLSQRQISDVQLLTKEEEKYQQALQRRQAVYNTTSKAFDQHITQYEQALASQQKLENALTSREQNTIGGFTRRIANSAAYIAGYGVFNTITSGLTSGLAAIRDYELGVTDLRRTLEKGEMSFTQFEAQLSNFGQAAVEDAKEFGVAITDAQEAMTELARAGVGASDLEGMTESVLMGLNTTELETASDVTSALVSTIKQMKMEWSDSSMILDSWNFLADRYAVQTDDFAHAIERSGAASKMLGMDLYDLNAVVTILGESTQASGEQVGTAFRSLSARLLRESTINKLAEYGIQVKDTNGQFLEFRDIMNNINDVIKDLPDDSIILSDIMDTLGGAWRKNWITALTQDWGRFDKLVAQQAESVGYSVKENEKAMDTIAKKAETLKQTFLEAFIDIGEAGGEDAIKDLLDGTASALESAINSPALRSVADFLFSNPLESLGVVTGAGLFSKFTGGINPLQKIAQVVTSKISNDPYTLGGFINGLYMGSGVSGKQNRAENLYDSLKKNFDLTDTEMLPIAGRIDDIFKSSTTSIAQAGSEVERLTAQLKDAQNYSKSLFTDEGKESFYKGLQLDSDKLYDSYGLAALQREQQRSIDLVVDYDRQLKQAQATQDRFLQSSSKANERSIFSSIESSRLKEGIRSFVGGLASGAVQMVAIAAAAQGIDYLLNWNENQHSDFYGQIEQYEQAIDSLKQQQESVLSMEKDFNATGALVSRKGTSSSLSEQELASFNTQLEELRSIDPSVAAAIDASARSLGNYSEAATVAAEAIAQLRQQEAATYLSESRDDYADNMKAWQNELMDESAGWYSQLQKAGTWTKQLQKLGIQGDIDESTGNISVLNDEYALSNLEKIAENRDKIASILRSQGRNDEYIEDFFDQVAHDQDLINTAISDSQRQGGAELERNMLALQDAVGGAEAYQESVNSLNDLIQSAQSVNQAEMLEGFTKNLSRDKQAFADYTEAQADLAESFSKESVTKISDAIRDYAEEAKSEGLVDDSESLANAMFEQYFGFNEQEYQSMVNKMADNIKSTDLDLSKAFGVDKIADIKANQIEGIYDFINELTYKMNEGNEAAARLQKALNNDLINGINWEKADEGTFSNFFQLDTSQADAVINAISAMEQKAGSLGETLSTAFGGDVTAAFENLSAVAQSGAQGFADSMNAMFDSIDVDWTTKANLVNEIASALNMDLTDEMLIPLGFKIENGSIVSALSEAEQAAQGVEDLNVPIKGKYEEGSAEQAAQEAASAAEGTEANITVGAEGDPAEGAEAAEETASGADGVDAKVDVSAKGNPSEGAAAAQETASGADGVNANVDVGANAEPGAGADAANQIANEAESVNPKVTIFPEIKVGESLAGMMNTMDSFFQGGGTNQTIEVQVKADTSQAREQISQLMNSENTTKLDVQADTAQAESQIQSLLSRENTSKLQVQADTARAEAQIESLSAYRSTVDVDVNADTSQAQSAIDSLGGYDRSVDIQVNADTSQAQYEIDSLGGYGTEVNVQVNADTSAAESTISSLGSAAGTVNVPVEADTSRAISQIQAIRSAVPDIRVNVTANVAPLQASLASIRSQAAGVQASLNAAAAAAASAGAGISAIMGQVAMAQAAILQLQALAAVPIVFQVDVSQLSAVGPAASAAAAAANAAMAQMQSQIAATAAAFSAGCAQMVSAWASMSFPAPYIPTPHITTSVGLGTYDVNIAWYATGGIIPATPGGRVVGVAEGGEDEAIIPISKLQDYIKTSMADVLEDALDDYSDIMDKSWENFRVDYNTMTANGYYATRIQMPLMELSPETKEILENFTNKTFDFSGYDPKDTSYAIDYIMRDTNQWDMKIEDAQQMVEFYEAYGDAIGKAHAETNLLVLQWQQAVRIQGDAAELAEQLNYLQSVAGEDLAQYVDANLELNMLYQKRVDSFGEGNDEAKEAFENQVKGYQEVLQAMEDLQHKLMQLNIEMTNKTRELAQSMIEDNINTAYDSQISALEERLKLVERERDQYEKDIEEQRKRLEDAREDFEDDIEDKQDELQDRIDAIRDEQDRRENQKKLEDLQEKIKDAQDRLDGLNNEYNTKVYTMDENGNWQFEWAANPEELEEALEDLEDAQDDLKEYYEDQEIDRLEDQQDYLDEELENYQDHYDDMIDALEEQQEMRLEAYDEEIEMLNLHIDNLQELQQKALDNAELMAKQLVDYLLGTLGSITSVFEYLQVASGNYGVESFNPWGELYRTEYADQLYNQGVDLEEYTNYLLGITRNPGKYNPQDVYDAYKELEKLGTTGSVNIDDRVDMTDPDLIYALKGTGSSGVGELVYSLISRIGTVRTADSGQGQAAGSIVTAQDVANELNRLGIGANALQVADLAQKIKNKEIDKLGNTVNSIEDILSNFGSDYDFGESGQGLLTDSAWSDLTNAILGFDGTAQGIYDLTGKLITTNEENLGIGNNVILHQIKNEGFLSSLLGQNVEYQDMVSNYFTDLIGKMDANEYYGSGVGVMNEDLKWALQGNTDVNEFILGNLDRIGTIRTAGDKAGQVVTDLDMQKYFDQLGIDGKLVKNTVLQQAALELATSETGQNILDNSSFVDENTGELTINTDALKNNMSSIIKNSSALSQLYDSNGNLKYSIDGLPNKFSSILEVFGDHLEDVIGSIESGGSTTDPDYPDYKPEEPDTGGGDDDQDPYVPTNPKAPYASYPGGNQYSGSYPNAALDYAMNEGYGSNRPASDKETIYNIVRDSVIRVDPSAPNHTTAAAIKNYLINSLGIKLDYVRWVAERVGLGSGIFAKGGVVDYTGLANVHGTPTHSEVVFNAEDAKKLYNLVRNLDLTTLALPRIATADLTKAFGKIDSKQQPVHIDNITMEFPRVNDPEGVRTAILNLSRDIRLYTKQ